MKNKERVHKSYINLYENAINIVPFHNLVELNWTQLWRKFNSIWFNLIQFNQIQLKFQQKH